MSRIPELETELVASAERLQRPRGLLGPTTRVAVAVAAVVVVAVLVVVGATEKDRGRRAGQTSGAPPSQPAPGTRVVTDVDDAIRWRLDGRVLTVQLLPYASDRTLRMVNGTRIRATCGTKVASPLETTLTRRWPPGQTSLSYRFPRDVSSWCWLADPAGRSVAFVTFPGASPGARELITEAASNWALLFASNPQNCNEYIGSQPVCEQLTCQRPSRAADNDHLRPIPNCTRPTRAYGESFRDATIQEIAIRGDKAAARFSNGETIRLDWHPNGDWLVAKIGRDAGRGILE